LKVEAKRKVRKRKRRGQKNKKEGDGIFFKRR
jgi:hypothetical protein